MVAAATIDPLAAWTSSFRVSALRRTAVSQGPSQSKLRIHAAQFSIVRSTPASIASAAGRNSGSLSVATRPSRCREPGAVRKTTSIRRSPSST